MSKETCCCGGCRGVPMDRSAATGAVIALQAKCCSCLPKNLCVVVASETTTSSAWIPLGCGAVDPVAPIQYAGSIEVGGENRTFRLRLDVRGDDCWITWEITGVGLSGERLIDPNEPPDPYQCDHGQKAAACAQFGGEWETGGYTITISEAPVLEVLNRFGCSGCNCMCRCLCMSVYSRSSEGVYTLYGTNDIVCAEIEERFEAGCGDDFHFEYPKVAKWMSNGWTVYLQEAAEHPIGDYVLNAGQEIISSPCDVRAAVWKTDALTHDVWEYGGIDVEYHFHVEAPRKGLEIKWTGRTYDENAIAEFFAWNWTISDWDLITSVNGRPGESEVNSAIRRNLEPEHTGPSGPNEGDIKIRIVSDGSLLVTDMIRVISDSCCGWRITPPEGVSFATPLPKIPFDQDTNPCPNPTGFWNATDTSGVEWFVSVGCSWCNGTCGTQATDCCPRPIGPTLFFEGVINCVNCPGAVSVPLFAGPTGGIWTGSATYCDQQLEVTFSCGGSGWQLSIQLGTCTWSGSASNTDCDPLSVDFAGTIGGGLGCCGPGGDPFANPTFTGTVFE